MSSINAHIDFFFRELDGFLQVQFEHAQGHKKLEDVLEVRSNLINSVKNLNFNDESFDNAKIKWLDMLSGLEANLGFSELQKLPREIHQLTSYLEQFRTQLSNTNFLTELKVFSGVELQLEGLKLSTSPKSWLKNNDILLNTNINPNLFKDKLFNFSNFQPGDHKYYFVPSKNDKFFMISLHTTPAFYIGHGQLNSLFNLSTLAHEIGHSLTAKEKSLRDYFLSEAKRSSSNTVFNDEDDSYLYEKLFMENIEFFTKELKIKTKLNLDKLLLKRKSIQYNTHLLASKLNYLFFNGESLDSISSTFSEKMNMFYPDFKAEHEFSWLEYATLDRPLSRVGYLKSFQKHFL